MTTRNPLPPGVVRSRANTELEFKLKALRGTVGTDATPFTHIRSGSKYVGEFGTLVNEQSLVAIAKPDELKAMGLTLPAVMPSSG